MALRHLPRCCWRPSVDCWHGTNQTSTRFLVGEKQPSTELRSDTTMHEITNLLRAASAGDQSAREQVIALLYQDLRRLARGRMHKSGELTMLDTTSLVHEAYLRLQRVEHR